MKRRSEKLQSSPLVTAHTLGTEALELVRGYFKMSGPIPLPGGCSDAHHIGYDPLTVGKRARLPPRASRRDTM